MLTLQGVRRLIRFDQVGFLFFDASRRGFWLSFGAALVCLPIWALAEYQQIMSPHGEDGIARFLALQITAYVVSWLAYPLLVLKIADMLGVWPNYYRYMVAYNWFQPVLQLMWAPLLILDALQTGQATDLTRLLYILIQIGQGAYGWFMARFGLGLSGWNALALTLIDLMLGLLIDLVTIHL